MKKTVIATTMAMALAASSSALAGLLSWGSFDLDTGDYIVTVDNNSQTFTGYAFLFLLNNSSDAVTWNGTSWTVPSGGAQILYSAAGTLLDGDNNPIPGTWGDITGTLESTTDPTKFYQVILTTSTAATTLTGINSGFWASTVTKGLDLYSPAVEGIPESGFVTWTSRGDWNELGGEAVPEPTTMALFGLGGLAMVIRRKMRKEA